LIVVYYLSEEEEEVFLPFLFLLDSLFRKRLKS
jgi:hypothetical protein